MAMAAVLVKVGGHLSSQNHEVTQSRILKSPLRISPNDLKTSH